MEELRFEFLVMSFGAFWATFGFALRFFPNYPSPDLKRIAYAIIFSGSVLMLPFFTANAIPLSMVATLAATVFLGLSTQYILQQKKQNK